MRSDGITLPSNGSPVRGSRTTTPDCEKSPARSAAVGMSAEWVVALCETECWTLRNVCGPYFTTQGILSGPPKLKPICRSSYEGAGGFGLVNEYGAAFQAELPSATLTPPL
jgi:hypothetical protein